MPRFTSFSSHVEDLIKKFHQAINAKDYTLIKSLWLNEEGVSMVDQTGELLVGVDDIIETLKMRELIKVDILGCKSHSFAGLIMTETLEAWSPLPAQLVSTSTNQDVSEHIQQSFLEKKQVYEPNDVEYIYGTYITTQNYPDWQFMRIHLSYANYAAASYHCFEHVKGFH